MRKAFTLIELATVVTVIAILITSISVGMKLVERGRLQGVIKEIKNIQTASYSFQTIYNDLPGDMPNAFEFFEANDCGFAANVNGDQDERCNGDGNNQIAWDGQGGHCAEMHNFWNHMQYANLIYTKHFDCYAYYESTKFKGMTIAPYYLNLNSNPVYNSNLNVLRIGAQIPSEITISANRTFQSFGKLFSPRQARYIDKKLDDGIAYSGQLQGFNGDDEAGAQGSGCSSNSPNANNSTNYKVENDSIECYLIIPINIAL